MSPLFALILPPSDEGGGFLRSKKTEGENIGRPSIASVRQVATVYGVPFPKEQTFYGATRASLPTTAIQTSPSPKASVMLLSRPNSNKKAPIHADESFCITC